MPVKLLSGDNLVHSDGMNLRRLSRSRRLASLLHLYRLHGRGKVRKAAAPPQLVEPIQRVYEEEEGCHYAFDLRRDHSGVVVTLLDHTIATGSEEYADALGHAIIAARSVGMIPCGSG